MSERPGKQDERRVIAIVERRAFAFVSYRTALVAGETRSQSLRAAATVPIFAKDRPRRGKTERTRAGTAESIRGDLI